MSMFNHKLRTSRWLWAACSIGLFNWMGSVIILPFGKMFATYWEFARVGLSGQNSGIGETAFVLSFYGAFLGVPACALGWIAQALIVAGRSAVIAIRSRLNPVSPT